MKKVKPLEIKEDPSIKVRRRARAAVGSVKPSRPITPRNLRPPRHKKPLEDQEP